MMQNNELLHMSIENLLIKYPFLMSYFENNKLDINGYELMNLEDYLQHFSDEDIETWAIDVDKIKLDLSAYLKQMLDFLGINDQQGVDHITIQAGQDKSGNNETFGEITISKGDIISIVGPTGSGKSRLLADIEWTANCDTPTKRRILINGSEADPKWRFSTSNKLVAQLSQNMNFVMDLSVEEFVELHANSRMVNDVPRIVNEIIEAANALAGEGFHRSTPITSLSGGQSRALMIADTAILSTSPIVLIDEIENAGIDRKRALELLVGSEKIVLIATHDPSLALMADQRIVIKNGGIHKIIKTDQTEKSVLKELEKLDMVVQTLRTNLRAGEIIDHSMFNQLMPIIN